MTPNRQSTPRFHSLFTSVVVTLLCVACGEPAQDVSIELGGGYYDSRAQEFSYLPLASGDSLPYVNGLQGGQHAWVILRLGVDEPSDLDVSVTLTTDSGVLASIAVTITAEMARLVDAGGRALLQTPALALILHDASASRGELVSVDARVDLPDGRSGRLTSELKLADAPSAGVSDPNGPPDDVEFLDITEPDLPRFVAETLSESPSGCAGLADLIGGPELEVLLVDSRRVWTLVLRGDRQWDIIETWFRPDGPSTEVGCQTADFDGDGVLDIAIAGPRVSALLHGEGDGTFSVVENAFPPLDQTYPGNPLVGMGVRAGGLAVLDFDLDGRQDLYYARTVNRGAQLFLQDGCAVADDGGIACGTEGVDYPGMTNVVLRNVGGRFEEIAGAGAEGHYQSQCAATWDANRDGALDIFVCNDGATSRLYLGDGQGAFSDATDQLGLTDFTHGMGVAVADFDQDGLQDLYVTDIGRGSIWRGLADGSFEPGPLTWMLGMSDQWGWGVEPIDVDNDGQTDLLVSGHVTTPTEENEGLLTLLDAYPKAPTYMLHVNRGGGVFSTENATALGSNLEGDTIALVSGDIDLDGRVDAVAVPSGDGATLLWGQGELAGGWVAVNAPLGALVEICAGEVCNLRHVLGGGSYGAIRPSRVRMGIGGAEQAHVCVEWPAGEWHDLGAVDSGTIATFDP